MNDFISKFQPLFDADNGGGAGGGEVTDTGATPPNDEQQQGGQGGAGDIQLPTTVEELQKVLELERQRVGDQERTKARKERERLEEEKEALLKEKMTAEQKAQFDLDKRERELRQREQEYQRQQMEITALGELSKHSLPSDFKDFFIGETKEQTEKNVAQFNSLFQDALNKAVDAKLAENARPPRHSGSGGATGSGHASINDMIRGIR